MLAVVRALADAAVPVIARRRYSARGTRSGCWIRASAGSSRRSRRRSRAPTPTPSDHGWSAPLGALLTDAPVESLRALDGRLTTQQAQMCEPVAAALAAAPAVARAGERSETPDELLHRFGLSAFRPGQREAVQAALDGRSTLLLFPTGSGKSLCYQLPAIADGDRLTVVVSPLIALIADQHNRLTALGVRSAMLASTLSGQEAAGALQALQTDAQIVFCAPERFANGAFRRALSKRRIRLFVVDEADCVSQWGHDFRPDYLRLRPVIEELGRPPVMAATATATPKWPTRSSRDSGSVIR